MISSERGISAVIDVDPEVSLAALAKSEKAEAIHCDLQASVAPRHTEHHFSHTELFKSVDSKKGQLGSPHRLKTQQVSYTVVDADRHRLEQELDRLYRSIQSHISETSGW